MASGAAKGSSAMLDLEELLATRLLVQGNSGSGKSHLLRRLLEQSAPMVQQAVIDPEGDFVTLAEKFGHVVVDAARSEGDLQRIAARVRQHRVSVVLNLEGLDTEAQMRCAAAFLGGLFDADRDLWYPMLVVVDEAQLFAPSAAGEVSDETRKISLGAMTNLMCRGRKRGLAGIIATQRLAKLAKNVAAEASNFLMGRTFLDIDMARAADLLGMERRQAEMFRDLERGISWRSALPCPADPFPVRIGDVATSARSGSFKLDAAARPAQGRGSRPDFHRRRRRGRAAGGPAPSRRLRLPRPPTISWPSLPGPGRRAAEPAAGDDGGDRRPSGRCCSTAILREILADPEAAFRTVAVLYQDFLVRCRIRRVGRRASQSSGLPPPLGGGPRGRRCGDRRGLRMGSRHDVRGGSRRGYPGRLPAPRPRRDGGSPLSARRRNRTLLRQPLARSRPPARRLSGKPQPRGDAQRSARVCASSPCRTSDGRPARAIRMPTRSRSASPEPGSFRRRLKSARVCVICKSGLATRGSRMRAPQPYLPVNTNGEAP